MVVCISVSRVYFHKRVYIYFLIHSDLFLVLHFNKIFENILNTAVSERDDIYWRWSMESPPLKS